MGIQRQWLVQVDDSNYLVGFEGLAATGQAKVSINGIVDTYVLTQIEDKGLFTPLYCGEKECFLQAGTDGDAALYVDGQILEPIKPTDPADTVNVAAPIVATIGILASFLIIGFYGLLYYLAARKVWPAWTAFSLFALDTLLLVGFALLSEDLAAYTFEFLFHAYIVWSMLTLARSKSRLSRLMQNSVNGLTNSSAVPVTQTGHPPMDDAAVSVPLTPDGPGY